MRAIGYVKPILIDKDTGEVIPIEEQKERIIQYAKLNNIDLIEIYEDEDPTCTNVAERPAIKKILSKIGDFDLIVVERVWCLTRMYKDLEKFLDTLYDMGIQVVSASTLWDCTSQKVRQYYYKRKKEQKAYRKSA